MTQTFDRSDRQLLRAGGISALVLVAGYLATFPLYAVVGGPPPSGSEARLAHYAAHLPGWWGILGLMVSTDILYLIAWYALHQVLKSSDRNVSLLSLVCATLFVGLDLAVTWPHHAAMFVLGETYAVADAADKAAIVAAAGFPAALLDSPLPGIYAIIIPSIGPFLAGLVMWKSKLSRTGAILALLIGLTGVPSVAGPYVSKSLELLHVPNALLVMAWFAVVGVRLLQLAGAQTAPPAPNAP